MATEALLAVLDMQEGYPTAEVCCSRVCQLLEQARANNWWILLIRLVGWGRILQTVRAQIRDYARGAIIQKRYSSGAPAIRRFCALHGLEPQNLILAGVRTDCCLAITLQKVVEKEPELSVIVPKSCCATHTAGFNWREFARWSRQLGNVSLSEETPKRLVSRLVCTEGGADK